ncbi:SDR family oxidoreductase [Nocardiopsis composta]
MVGDLADPASLEGAFNGVDAVFLLWPLFSAETAPAVLKAAARHTERVVYLSSTGVDDTVLEQGDPINDFHARIERLLAESGLRWTAVRGGGFAANDLGWAEQVRQGATSIATPSPTPCARWCTRATWRRPPCTCSPPPTAGDGTTGGSTRSPDRSGCPMRSASRSSARPWAARSGPSRCRWSRPAPS